MLPQVLIIYTGGTFGMEPSQKGSKLGFELADLSQVGEKELTQRFLERVPELAGVARIQVLVLMNRDSAHMGSSEWVQLAEAIRKRGPRFAGVVVLHGTDTLAYTASALSFLLQPSRRPVVLTGAMRPLAMLRTDARRNLISAVEIAATAGRRGLNEVMVFFDDRLMRGNRVRKRSATEFRAFESPRFPPLAMVGTGLEYTPEIDRPGSGVRLPRLKPSFSSRVAWVHASPSAPWRLYTQLLGQELEGVLIEVFASGTAPTSDQEFVHFLRRARELGIPVVVVSPGANSRSESGVAPRVDPSGYAAGRAWLEEGAIWAGEMTPECAYVKLCLLLGQGIQSGKLPGLFKRDWAGELGIGGTR